MKKTPTKIKTPNKRVRENPPRISKTPNKRVGAHIRENTRLNNENPRFGICE